MATICVRMLDDFVCWTNRCRCATGASVAYTCRVQSGGDEGAHQDEGGRYTYTLQRWLFVDHRTPLRLVLHHGLPT